jgi:hypothetical protein
MADRQALANALMSDDQAAMQPETYANPVVRKMLGDALTLPQRAIDASAQDVQHLGEPDYQRQSIGPALETATNMMGGAGGMSAEANTLRSGLKLRNAPKDNYLGPISNHTDTLYREMSPGEALSDLPTSVASGGGGPMGAARKFYADHPDMALGQGGNRGVRVQYDSSPFEGTINKNKPAWDLAYQNGMAEYQAAPKVGTNIRDAVRGFEIDPSTLSRVEGAQYQRILANLQNQGWSVDKANGKIIATKPNLP